MHHCVVGGIAVCFSWFAFWRIGGTIRRENAMILALFEMPKKQTANHIHSVCSDFSICCVLTHYYEEPEVNVNGHTPHTPIVRSIAATAANCTQKPSVLYDADSLGSGSTPVYGEIPPWFSLM